MAEVPLCNGLGTKPVFFLLSNKILIHFKGREKFLVTFYSVTVHLHVF